MARLLAYTSATPGHVFPPIGMLLELRRRGHEIHVRTQAPDVERLGALGFDVAAIDPRIEEIEFDDWRARSQVNAMRRIVTLPLPSASCALLLFNWHTALCSLLANACTWEEKLYNLLLFPKRT